MKKRGLVAILDALLAYTTAFLAIGFLMLLMTNTPEAGTKTSYTLNVWAEDIADSVAQSSEWSDDLEPLTEQLNSSLAHIAEERGLSISVRLGGSPVLEKGSIGEAGEVATSRRFLADPEDGSVSELTVRVGI